MCYQSGELHVQYYYLKKGSGVRPVIAASILQNDSRNHIVVVTDDLITNTINKITKLPM